MKNFLYTSLLLLSFLSIACVSYGQKLLFEGIITHFSVVSRQVKAESGPTAPMTGKIKIIDSCLYINLTQVDTVNLKSTIKSFHQVKHTGNQKKYEVITEDYTGQQTNCIFQFEDSNLLIKDLAINYAIWSFKVEVFHDNLFNIQD